METVVVKNEKTQKQRDYFFFQENNSLKLDRKIRNQMQFKEIVLQGKVLPFYGEEIFLYGELEHIVALLLMVGMDKRGDFSPLQYYERVEMLWRGVRFPFSLEEKVPEQTEDFYHFFIEKVKMDYNTIIL